MKRYLTAIGIAAALVLTYVGARAELSPLLGIYNADNATFYCGLLVYPACPYGPAGKVATIHDAFPSGTGTAEQVLASYPLPGGALDQPGRRVRVYASFHFATNGNNKTIKLYFGSSVITSGVLTDSNKNAWLSLDVLKTSGNSTQNVNGRGQHDTTMITPYLNAGADDDTSPIVIKATGTDGTSSAGDIVLEDFYVEYLS